MAGAALGPRMQVLFENIFNKIGSLMGNEVRFLEGLTEALEELEFAARKFQRVLRAAEMKKFKSPDTNDWYRRLGYAANVADGVLEEALDFVDSNKRVRNSNTNYPIASVVEIRRGNLGENVRSVTRKFNNLDDEQSKLNFEQISIKRETVSALSEVVFGREEEKEKIITTLLSSANTHPFIHAIVGLGGIGKTTLAQLIYNDQKVVEQFDTRIWVWVSQTFDVKLVMEKIIETLSEQTCKFESLETTQRHLNKLLKGKKFLLVLDDNWNENELEWNKLKSSLKYGEAGSSVLLTTRGHDVASIARAHDQHNIALLSEEQCWHVFKESAFLENGELEVIGKQIAKKCGGLPLAAKSLGGSLRLTREVREWEYVRDSPIWELPQEGDILPSLKLSLERLESHSRKCFTFSCVFPKGHEMPKEYLIQLWMANDLIPSHPRLEPEDMGNKIFNDLVLKSFFQQKVSMSFFYQNVLHYFVTIHDLMHDLCLSFKDDCFSLQNADVPDTIPPQCLHLSIFSSFSSYPSDILETLSESHSSLRTCIFLQKFDFTKDTRMQRIIFKNLDCLRALDLSNTGMQDLPRSIGKMKDLKYLDLSRSGITHLPDSIHTLTKLQTLKLRKCLTLTQLPYGITRLFSLRHLDLRWCEKLTHLQDGVTQLVNLRYLDLCGCKKLTHLPDGMGRLMNLRHLDLYGCKKLTHLPDGMGRLMNLRYLDLCWCEELTHLPDEITGLVNLEHLVIYGSKVTQLPNGMGQLVSLRMLILQMGWFFVGRETGLRITELQGLNQLTGTLAIRDLEHVRDAREAEAAFLKNKNNLSSLLLVWGDLEESDESEAESESDEREAESESDESEAESVLEALQGSNNNIDEVEAVLEALQPPQSLNGKLVIEGYGGSVFASWMKLLENLVYIKLRDCIKCERLPPLGQLPFLERLTIKGMKSLKRIGTEFYGTNDNSSSERHTIFPSLEELKFIDMPVLEEWQDIETKDNSCIGQLTLRQCPKLTSLPPLILSFVREIKIWDCDKVRSLTYLELDGKGTKSVTSFPEGLLQNLDALESHELSNLATLRVVDITSCPALQCLPVMNSSIVHVNIDGCQSLKSLSQSLSYLSNLVDLSLIDCEQLEFSSEDFENLIKLEFLKLSSLPKLTSLPELQHLHSLLLICLVNLPKLTSLSELQHLHSLKSIELEDLSKLTSLPELQHLHSLKSIYLQNLPKLTSLPELQHLHSLQELRIWDCKNLKVLPQGLQNLASLETLEIKRCHRELHSGCVEDSGEYWPFIKHIPKLIIDEPYSDEDTDQETPPRDNDWSDEDTGEESEEDTGEESDEESDDI